MMWLYYSLKTKEIIYTYIIYNNIICTVILFCLPKNFLPLSDTELNINLTC